MRNEVYVIILMLAVAAVYFSNITGFSVNESNINITIMERLNARIPYLRYNSTIGIGDLQVITGEMINTGSTDFIGKVDINIYYYNNSRLEPVANYYDAPAYYYPGMRKSFRSVFVPVINGTFYIEAKGTYDSRITQTWGAFFVYGYEGGTGVGNENENQTTTEPGSGTGAGGGGGGAGGGGGIEKNLVMKDAPKVSMTINYPKEINLHKKESYLTSIIVNNTAEIDLYQTKLQISFPYDISVNIYPKELFIIKRNETSSFFISFYVSENITEGKYPLNFEVANRYLSEQGQIALNVVSWDLTKDELEDMIRNYQLMIYDIQEKISIAGVRGYVVDDAQAKIDLAKANLTIAQEHFNNEDYNKTKIKLGETKNNIEDAAFSLANSMIVFYIYPVVFPIWIIILIIIAVIIILFMFFYYRKKKKQKPKMLRKSEEG